MGFEPGKWLRTSAVDSAVLSVAALNAHILLSHGYVLWTILAPLVKCSNSVEVPLRLFTPGFSSVFRVRIVSLRKHGPAAGLFSQHLTCETNSLVNSPRLLLSSVWLAKMVARREGDDLISKVLAIKAGRRET